MVPILDFALLILAIPQAVYQLAVWLYWWQDKEYRSDRFYDFVLWQDSVRKLYLWQIAAKLISIAIFTRLPQSYLLIFLVYIYSNFWVLFNILSEGVRKPVFTTRAVRIFSTSLVIYFLSYSLYFLDVLSLPVCLFFSEVILIVSINLGISWTKVIADRVKRAETKEAVEKLALYKPFVVGVTGSYGKSTTKDFIYEILNAHFSTQKTKKNENTDFGIIRRVITTLNTKIKYFVCEMGAYRIGEIASICKIVKPNLGVLTGIEEQHLSLFGSIENIIKAKFELIDALPKGAVVVVNGNNKYVNDLLKKIDKLNRNLKVFVYGPASVKRSGVAGGFYKNVRVFEKKTVFDFEFEGKTNRLETSITTEYLLENISAAIIVSRVLNVPWDKIKKSLLNLKTEEGTSKIVKLKNGSILIDDSHNATPRSFESAVGLANKFGLEKIIVTPGIIELGKMGFEVHRNLASMAKRSGITKVLVTSEWAYKSIKSGFGIGARLIIDPSRISKEITTYLDSGNSLVLLEGRMPKMVNDNLANYIKISI